MSSAERDRENRKIQNKRTGRTRKICGWVLVLCGALNLIDSMQYMAFYSIGGFVNSLISLLLLASGLWIIQDTKKKVAKWDTYDALINPNGNTPIRTISQRTGIPADKVRSDIQKMINNGFFRGEDGNNEAYINEEYDILVMMRNGQPIEPLEKTAKEQAAQAEAQSAGGDEEDLYAEAIARAAASAKDPDVADSLRSIESSVRKINRIIRREPELQDNDSVRQLKNIYLPKTMELVDKLNYESAGSEAMLEIKGILNTCATAYKNIVDKVYRSEDEDTLIDIEVLRKTFEREGLLGSDFDI